MVLSRLVSRLLLAVALLIWVTAPAFASQWTQVGPDGGDARALSFDPHNPDHILLGTSSGELFESHDAGANWSRLAHLGADDAYVLDHIVFHPTDSKIIYVAAWNVDDPNVKGEVFVSHNGGHSWESLPGMHDRSIRSFAMAPNNPKILVAGTLDGVYRSEDAGKNWQRISPEGHADIKNIESLAVDAQNPDVIYAGTFHLPWKTMDGGRTWQHMKQGIVDDSDVFSIIIDYSNNSNIYLSACSGIYKSESAGAQFSKVQGMPFSARRTRMLHQDPSNPSVVYAGTTEGLWKTADAGKSWKRVTAPNIIVNDISVDPRNPSHVVLATDGRGVLMSEDGAATFTSANHGFVHRRVEALLNDQRDAGTIYAGVVNDKEFGGVFVSHDGGAHWKQDSMGLNGRDVFVLRQASNGDLLAGTNNGMFARSSGSATWHPMNDVVIEKKITRTVKATPKAKARRVTTVSTVRSTLTGRVSDIFVNGKKWYAATSQGLFMSETEGRSWHGGPVQGNSSFISVRANSEIIVAASLYKIVASVDGGSTWYQAKTPYGVAVIHSVAIGPDSNIWVAAREGAFRSGDGGEHWNQVMNGLPQMNLASITNDRGGRLLATAVSAELYESSDSGRTWHSMNAGWKVRSVLPTAERLLATTPYEGIVAQPATEAAARNGSRPAGGSER